jgi:hypothetical protein
MSRYDHADERDVRRAMIVDEFGDVSWREYLRRRKRD